MANVCDDIQDSIESPSEHHVSHKSVPCTTENEDKLEEQKSKESKQGKAKESHPNKRHFKLSNCQKLASLKRPLRHFVVAKNPLSSVKYSKFTLDKNYDSKTPLQLNAQKCLQLSNNLLKADQSDVPSSKEVKSADFDLSINEFPESDFMCKVSPENSSQDGTEVPNFEDVKNEVFNISFNEFPETDSMCNFSAENTSQQGTEGSNSEDVKTKVFDMSYKESSESESMYNFSAENSLQHGIKVPNSEYVKTEVFDTSFIESAESEYIYNVSAENSSRHGTEVPNSKDMKSEVFNITLNESPETDSICDFSAENSSQQGTEVPNSKSVKTEVINISFNESSESNSMCNVLHENSSKHRTETAKEEMTVVEQHVSVTFLPIPYSETQLLSPQQVENNIKEKTSPGERKNHLRLHEFEFGEQSSLKEKQQLSGQSTETKDVPEMETKKDTEKSYGKRPAFEQDSAKSNKKRPALECERCKSLSNNTELSNDEDISCEFCSKEFDCYCALDFHKVTIHIEKKPHCALCCKVLAAWKLSAHLQSHGLTSQDLMITCDECNVYGFQWSNKTVFKKETFCKHLQEKDTLYNNVLIKCPKCSAEFDRLEFFESHREKMHKFSKQ